MCIRTSIIIIILLGLLQLASAQELLDEFDDTAGLAPPAIPQIDEAVQKSQEQIDQAVAKITFVDVFSGENISEAHIHITLDQDGKVSQNLYYMDQTTLHINLAQQANATFRIDELSTEGSDYYAQGSITPGENILHAFPVGSVQGQIISGEKVVSGAIVHVDCSSNYGDTQESRTNKFGSYKREWLPVGTCTISASYGDLVGYETIEVSQGELAIVDIQLSIEKTEKSNVIIYGLLAAMLIIIMVSIILFQQKGKRSETTKHIADEENKTSRRTEDIITTLNPKERKVVEFLLAHKNEATQGQIKNAINIPKTTLSRLLTSLEHKKVLEVEKIGKMKKTHLTAFFLGKE